MTNDDLPIGMMDQPLHIVERFWKMVKEGTHPRLAEMLAVRRGPLLDTDTAHFAGVPPLEKSLGKAHAEKIRAQARKAGIQVSESSFYNGSIADERQGADPGAWLLAGDGKDKYKQVIRDRGGASPELGVKFGESQKRTEYIQKKIEKQRAINKERAEIKRQKAADGIAAN